MPELTPERVALIRENWERNAEVAHAWFNRAPHYRVAVLRPMPPIYFDRPVEPMPSSAVEYLEYRKEIGRLPDGRRAWRVICEGYEVASGVQAFGGYGQGFYALGESPPTLSTNNLAAEQKSIELLKEWLTKKQNQDFDRHGYFHVIGGITSKRYRIERRSTFNVAELDQSGNVARSLCFVPTTAYAIGDIMLAQKIMLEQNEDEVLKIANFSSPAGGIIPRSSLYDELCQVTRRAFVRSRVINEGPIT
jgi:hypothetical protein